MIEVIPSFADVIGDLVYLANDLTEFGSGVQILLRIHEDPTFHFFPNLYWSQTLLCLNGFGNKASCLDFNVHELHHINSLKGTPTLIEFDEVLSNFIDDVFQIDIDRLLIDFAVNISEWMLKLEELDHEFRSMVQDVLSEGIFLPIDPKVRKTCIFEINTLLSAV